MWTSEKKTSLLFLHFRVSNAPSPFFTGQRIVTPTLNVVTESKEIYLVVREFLMILNLGPSFLISRRRQWRSKLFTLLLPRLTDSGPGVPEGSPRVYVMDGRVDTTSTRKGLGVSKDSPSPVGDSSRKVENVQDCAPREGIVTRRHYISPPQPETDRGVVRDVYS